MKSIGWWKSARSRTCSKAGPTREGSAQRNRERPLRRGFRIPLLRRGQKAGRRVQLAPSAGLCFAGFHYQSGSQEVGHTLPSPSQRYNTLDFASKVVCHETPARFLWILPICCSINGVLMKISQKRAAYYVMITNFLQIY